MKWVNSKINSILNTLFFSLLLSNSVFSQEIYNDVNIILIIDNELVTQNVELNFNNTDKENFQFLYGIGKSLKLPNSYLGSSEKTELTFSFLGKFKGKSKKYNYNIDFKKGWVNNTDFLILRIYNLDKRKYSKVFCNKEDNYVVEVQNSVYNNSEIICKKLKCKL